MSSRSLTGTERSNLVKVSDVLIERDAVTGASYYVLGDAHVARTVHVSDLIAVDFAADENPVGVEFAFSHEPRHEDWMAVFDIFPDLKGPLGDLA